jgi:hypothetical protein
MNTAKGNRHSDYDVRADAGSRRSFTGTCAAAVIHLDSTD